jgi:cysteine synthase
MGQTGSGWVTIAVLTRSTSRTGCNLDAHYEGTGPDPWIQTNEQLDTLVSGAGESGLRVFQFRDSV